MKFLVSNKARNAKLLLQSCDFMLTARRLAHVLKKEVAKERRSNAHEAAKRLHELEQSSRKAAPGSVRALAVKVRALCHACLSL